MKIYGVDLEIVMADQMSLHRNAITQEKTLNFKGTVQTTNVKKNHSLSRERVTVRTSVESEKSSSASTLEFHHLMSHFNGRLKDHMIELEHMIEFCDKVPAQPCALFPLRRKIFKLDDYSAHLDPSVKEALKKRSYFFIILLGRITGDL